ncbi:MAG TPA: M23 family metallopeptidase [Acidiferrobacteraceae bacterium]|nr:M23 family metallopeptidase [Acidiferrobacteraceae bacterium]
MNIILIPRNAKGANLSLTHGQAAVFALVLVLLPIFIGIMTYRMARLWKMPAPDIAVLQRERQFLHYERQEVVSARRNAADHLDALAARVGMLQAQMTRLNVLGSRLAHMAGIPRNTFDFKQEPPLGGPDEPTAAHDTVPDFVAHLTTLEDQISQKQAGLRALSQMIIHKKIRAAITPAGWPVAGGWITSPYGARVDPFTGHPGFHPGVDIADPMGTPIHAMAAGVVTWAGWNGGYGKLVRIDDGSGRSTYYGHTSKILVTLGELVKKGQVIALVGSTGRSTGPHLHFEVHQNGETINPTHYLMRSARSTP